MLRRIRETGVHLRTPAVTAIAVVVSVSLGYTGCSPDKGSTSSSSGAGTGGAEAGGSGGGNTTLSSGGQGGGTPCDPGAPSVDDDLDGFSEQEGDCNDCDPNANPEAIEVIAEPGEDVEPADEDCDGLVDEPPATCDAGLALDSVDPMDAARTLELCQVAGEATEWGLVSASYVDADGTPPALGGPSLHAGLLPKFGDVVVPHAGSTMLSLSSGHARDASQPDACGTHTCKQNPDGHAPPGYPQQVPNCPGGQLTMDDIADDVALEVVLRAPANAESYSFDFVFFSFEFPTYVCSSFNDQFIALVQPAPAEAINGNISFDEMGNAVSVSLGLFDHCDPASAIDYAEACQSYPAQCPEPPNPYCPHGPHLMNGTGFDAWDYFAGSTGWLTTTAPVTPGAEVTIRFAIWDTGDDALDSTVVIDNFNWHARPATVSTIPAPQ